MTAEQNFAKLVDCYGYNLISYPTIVYLGLDKWKISFDATDYTTGGFFVEEKMFSYSGDGLENVTSKG